MKSIQTFLERFNCIPFEEKPQILFQTWETSFAIQCSQPENSNELFQKLLKDLKKLAEYDQSTSTDRPIFLNGDEGHSVQDKESLKNPFNEIAVSKPDNESDLEPEATTDMELSSTEDIHPLAVQESPHDSDICQLIREECFEEVPEEQKQNMEKTMLELIEIYCHKQILCMYDNIDDLIESALDTKLFSINSIKSQRLEKKTQEVKNVEKQPAECRNHAEKSLQNFRVIHKNSISLNSSQIFSVHAVAPILSTREPENSLSMGYEHLSITPETEVTESNAKNLLPIPSECEVTLEDKRECVELICENSSTVDVCDNHSEILFDSNNDDLSSDDEIFEDIEYVDASIPDPEIASEEENIVQHDKEQEEVDLEDISQVQDVVLHEKLFSINRLISNIEFLNDKPTPVCVFNSSTSIPILEESDNSLSLPEFEIIYDHTEETRSDNTTTHANYSLPEYDLFQPPDDNFDFESEVISAVMEDIDEPYEHFNPGGEIFVSTNDEDVDYFPFMFFIRIFLPYLILPEISPLFLSAESEDTVFDPVEPEIRTIVEMADNRTMAQMLQAPIEGYGDAIVVPPINANNFELKQTLINLARRSPDMARQGTSKIDSDMGRSYVEVYKSILSTIKDQNEIINFLQKPNETFNEAWERFKDLLWQCPYYGFSELHQLDTFYNALNPNDQDALDFAAGGNFLDKIPRECLSIIESKSNLRYSRSRVIDVRANTNAPPPSSSP
nr:hypothetical protein [Tanacetum cinerariifolium]